MSNDRAFASQTSSWFRLQPRDWNGHRLGQDARHASDATAGKITLNGRCEVDHEFGPYIRMVGG